MAAVAPASDQAADLIQKLSLDSKVKTHESPEGATKPSAIKFGSINGGDVSKVPFPSCGRSTTPQLQEFVDPSMCYVPNGYAPYYYGGYEGSVNEWEDYQRYVNSDGAEIPPGLYNDNGSVMYHHGYGYPPYGAYPPPCSSIPSMGLDCHMYGPHHYQYPAPYYPLPSISCAPNQGPIPQADQGPAAGPKAKGGETGCLNGRANGYGSGPASTRPSCPNVSTMPNGSNCRGSAPSGTHPNYPDPSLGYDGARSPVPWLDATAFPVGKLRSPSGGPIISTAMQATTIPTARNHNFNPVPHAMGLHSSRPSTGMGMTPGFMGRMYHNDRTYGTCGSAARLGPTCVYNGFDSRSNGCGWLALDAKFKPRGRGNGLYGYWSENSQGLNELSKGPRAGRLKNPKLIGSNITLAVKGQSLPINENSGDCVLAPDREQYNREGFSVEYANAKFFIIKSYSEDDVHKSIKYCVWASTPNGNKKLDSAYQEAKENSAECPVFLFFSVNTSGQFVGLAEMMGQVDFNRSMEYWQQDKWSGCFPVKWHIVKDLPNSLVKHIILVNNDNKPVTNSRDCQEVELSQGLEMLRIFKEYSSKNSILDDFAFYEIRQKALQERKVKQQQFQKQTSEGKQLFEEGHKDDPTTFRSLPQVCSLGDVKLLDEEMVNVKDTENREETVKGGDA